MKKQVDNEKHYYIKHLIPKSDVIYNSSREAQSVNGNHHNQYQKMWKLTFPQRGGTLASKIQLNVSSKSDDITTRPLIPFSRSIRDDFMIRNNAL